MISSSQKAIKSNISNSDETENNTKITSAFFYIPGSLVPWILHTIQVLPIKKNQTTINSYIMSGKT